MKNYEHMARDVLQRIERIENARTRRKKRFVRGAAVMTCMAVLVLAGLMVTDKDKLTPSVSDDIITSSGEDWVSASIMQKVYLSNGNKRVTAMQVSQGIQYRLQVIDLRGLTQAQRKAQFDEQRQLIAAQQDAWMEQGTAMRGFVQQRDNVLVSSLSTTGFSLDVGDWTTVTQVKGECSSGYGQVELALYAPHLAGRSVEYTLFTADGDHRLSKPVYGAGNCWLYGPGVALSGEWCRDGKLTIMWKPDKALLEALDAQPETPLSAFSDTLTVAVSYQDGTVEEHTVRMHFSDDGVVDAVYEGVTRGE